MAETGCRISEALSITGESIDFEAGTLIIRCLKKRGKSVFREVPLSGELLVFMKRWIRSEDIARAPLWPWSRMTGYRRICEVMQEAGLAGDFATPRGLRHGFGVRAVQSGVPLNLVQRWLGHADMKTTAIYASASGPEERQIATRMWLDGAREAVRPHPGEKLQSRVESVRDQEVAPPPQAGGRAAIVSRPRPRRAARRPDTFTPGRTLQSTARLIYCHLLRYWLFCIQIFHCFSYAYVASLGLIHARLFLRRLHFQRPFGLIPDSLPSDDERRNRTIVREGVSHSS